MKSLGKRLLNEDLDEYLKGPIGGEVAVTPLRRKHDGSHLI